MLSYLEPVKQRVSQALRDFIGARRSRLAAVSPLGADAGDRLLEFALQGKMIRAAMVSMGFAISSRTEITDAPPAAIMTGAAMELFQSGLLVHDDIMDRDLTRRGRDSIFHQYAQAATRENNADPAHVGEALGICAGDVAFFLAFELLSALPVTEDVRAGLLGMCARELTAVGVAQMQDVAWGASQTQVDDRRILSMYCYKTGRYSFSLPLVAGGLLAGASPALQGQLESIGEAIGILFQIRDDELGLFGDEQDIGKPIGSDVREGKKTLLYTRLMEKATGRDRARLARLFGNRRATRRDLEYVRALATALGVRDSLGATTREIRERALKQIESMGTGAGAKGTGAGAKGTGAGAEKDRLRELVDFAVSRRQ